MRRKSLLLGSLMLLAAAAGIVPAARPPLTSHELNLKADLVVTGTVKAIHLVHEETMTTFVLDIVVQKLEKKGDIVNSGDVIKARGFRIHGIVKGCNGHAIDFLKVLRGQTIRVHLVSGKGAYDILLPNGVEVLEPNLSARHFQEMKANADLVVTGTVKAIDRTDTGYSVKIAVQKLEKGMGLKTGDLVVISYVFPADRAKINLFFDKEGLKGGQPIRAFLKKTADGQYHFLYPRGIVLIEPKPADAPAAKILPDQWRVVSMTEPVEPRND